MDHRFTSRERPALPREAHPEVTATRGERGSRIALLVFLFGVALVVSSIRPVTPPVSFSRTAIAEPPAPPLGARTFDAAFDAAFESKPPPGTEAGPTPLDSMRIFRVFRWEVPAERSGERSLESGFDRDPVEGEKERDSRPRSSPDPTLTKAPSSLVRVQRSGAHS